MSQESERKRQGELQTSGAFQSASELRCAFAYVAAAIVENSAMYKVCTDVKCTPLSSLCMSSGLAP